MTYHIQATWLERAKARVMASGFFYLASITSWMLGTKAYLLEEHQADT